MLLAAASLPVGAAVPAHAAPAPAKTPAPQDALATTTPPVLGSGVSGLASIGTLRTAPGTTTRYVDVGLANVRRGPGMGYDVVGTLTRGTRVTGTSTRGWLRMGDGRYIGTSILTGTAPGGSGSSSSGGSSHAGPTVTRWVTATGGNVRSGPSLSHHVTGTLRRGAKVTGTLTSNGWVQMPGGRFISGYILTGTAPGRDNGGGSRSRGSEVVRYVTATAGNVRSGPSTSHRVVGTLAHGTRIRGVPRSDGWLALGDGRFISGVILSAQAPGAGVAPPRTAPPPSAGSFDRAQLLSVAQRYTGFSYVYGGEDTSGFDCSGYTQFVFQQIGVRLPRTAAQQLAATTPTTDPRPGDLVFWGSWHLGIYAGNGYVYDAGRSVQQTSKRRMFPGVTSYGRVG
ncbi:MAG: SH3 domain-containing protein [Ornithinimicrobium sp.]|uniref:C40 family peptidase n=1 Tax=Ornithinimicrobium sp. TaxID=1977084 RepID=UPI003D9B2896